MSTTAPQQTSLALKEWSAAVHALAAGRQTLLLRKGGIHEKAFRVADRPSFLLLPTVAHSHAERVRPEHRDLLGPAAADVRPDRLVMRCGVRVHAAMEVRRPEGLGAIADLHIWSDHSITADRLAFRPRHRLIALVVDALVLPTPAVLARTDDVGGCRSWVHPALTWDPEACTAVVDRHRLDADADRVRQAVG